MKAILFLSALLMCCTVPAFGASGSLGRVTVQLEDPDGHPATNTTVRFAFMQGSKYERKTAVTDTNGLATAEAHARYYVAIATNSPDYYTSQCRHMFPDGSKDNIIKGKRQPWNPTVKLVVYPIRHPIRHLPRGRFPIDPLDCRRVI